MVPGEQVTGATHQFGGVREASERRAKLGVKEKKRLAVKGTQESAPGMRRSSRCKGLAAGGRDPVEHSKRGRDAPQATELSSAYPAPLLPPHPPPSLKLLHHF